MTFEYVILGFLEHGPKTGYELKKILDGSTQLFWHAELSQIYPVLKKMEQQGWVNCQVQPQEGKPDKKIYALTERGLIELRDWLASPIDQPPEIKNQVLLKLFFSGILTREEICGQLRCQLEIQRALNRRIVQEASAQIQSVSTGPEDLRGRMWEHVRRYGQAQVEMNVRWLEETLASLNAESSR